MTAEAHHRQGRGRVVVTGGAGNVAALLRPALRDDWTTVLLDQRPPQPPPGRTETAAVGDLADPGWLQAQLRGAAAVVHLAGIPSPLAPWSRLRSANVDLTLGVLEAARLAGVSKVVLASSVHASGQYDEHGPHPVDPAWPPRPCCLYGVSKVAGEAAGRYYADAHGLHVLCLRLGWVRPRPGTPRAMREWLSPGDLGRLVRAALQAEVRYGVYYGSSANSGGPWLLANAAAELGFAPDDNGAAYADRIDATAPDGLRDCAGPAAGGGEDG